MSTKLTRKSPNAGYDLVDSHALALTQAAGAFQDKMVGWLLTRLSTDGFETLTAAQLGFLGALDCGPNHASKLARTLGISRQAVHKTVRELERAGWLATRPDEDLGNQRAIVFTNEGERMMAAARNHFLDLDAALVREFGTDSLDHLTRLLEFDPA